MLVHIRKIPGLAFEKVQYYTVRLANKEISEYREFQQSSQGHSPVELAEINKYIELIGNKYGALPHHFKDEDAAEGLPPPYHRFIESDYNGDFGLRLYCIRLSPSVVILLNGARKTALKVQDCKNCFPHFDVARRISKKLTAAIVNGFIEINEDRKEIDIEEDFDLEL